jgi:hypothetical protein
VAHHLAVVEQPQRTGLHGDPGTSNHLQIRIFNL